MLGQSFEDSNNVRFEAISTAQGLSQSCVYSIVQDKKGFIWMGTRDGLNRYDGYDFLTFKNNPQDTNSISNNEITSICVNDEGNLWIGTRGGGLNYYDQSINKFTRYAYLNYENIVRAIFENEDKTLWVGTSEGLLKGKFNQAKGICSFTNVSTAGEYRNITGVVMEKLKRTLSVISIKKFSNDRLLIGAESGLFIFDKKNNQFNKVSLGESDNSIVTSSLLDADGSLWIGTFNGLVKLIPQTNGNYNSKLYNTRQKESHHLISNRIETLERDPFGNIWVGTHGGGLLKIEKTDKVTTFLNDKSDVQSIGDNTSNSLLIDNTGVLWIGTENAGCNKLDLFKKKFFHLRNLPNKINSLNDNQVTAIACGKGRSVWIGTASKGLDKLVYNPDGTYKVNHISEISDGNNGSVSEVISLYQDKEQDLWIGTASNSITQFKEGAGFKNYTTNGYVFSIHQDRSGRIWFGTWGQGLGEIDKRTGNIIWFPNVAGNPRSLSSDKVLSIYADNEGLLWVGTKAAGISVARLSVLASGKNDFFSFKHNKKKQLSLAHNDVYCITQDSKGNIWLGTGGGLSKIIRKKGQTFFESASEDEIYFESYAEKDGLPSNVIYGILEDNHGNLWLSTNNGLSVFDPPTKKFKNYWANDGVQANEFNPNAYLKNAKGDMFFGGINGLTIFNPDSIRENPAGFKLVITRLKILNTIVKPGTKVSGRKILNKDITQTSQIILTYKEKEITLDFSALYYANPQRIRYAYRLLGFNDNWQMADPSDRSVTYTNLYDGKYTFQVRASNVEGKWVGEPLEMKITILPPFWRKPWFYLIYAFIIIGLLATYRKYSLIAVKEKSRLAIERMEHKKVLEMSEAKMRFFTNISHEIRTPLTLIADPLDQVMTNGNMDDISRKNLSIISKNVKRLLGMVDQLLQLRNIDLGSFKLSISEINLLSFLKEITSHFEQTSNLRKINFSIINNLDNPLLYFDRETMGTVFFNLLSNAFKYAPDGGSVTIKAYPHHGPVLIGDILFKRLRSKNSRKTSWVAIEIADNGLGIPPKELKNIFHRFYQVSGPVSNLHGGSGIGLSLVKEYVELHKGIIGVKSVAGNGSFFTVYLRKGKNHFRQELLNQNHTVPLGSPTTNTHTIDPSSEILSSISFNNNHRQDLPSILIVEDDHELSDYLYDYFRKNYNIAQAYNGKVGLDLAIDISPDLIISDVMLPEVNGFGLCQKLKSTIETSHIPIILLTAKVTDENITEGYELGADLYMPKPFNIKILEKQVKMLIQSRILLRNKFSNQILLMPSEVTITSTDERFLKHLIEVTDTHLTDSEFDVTKLVDSMNMSHTVILRKLKALTGMALVDFIKNQRLKKAALILQKGKISIAEVSYMVGFSDPKYFSKCFIKEFGKTPTEYCKEYQPE